MNNRNENDAEIFPEIVPAPEPEQPEEPVQDNGTGDIDDNNDVLEEEVEPEIVEPVKREIIPQEVIFEQKQPSQNIKIKDESEDIFNDEPVKPKQKRKRRPMTEEAKAKLAIARAKGLETRKRNAELRKQAKMKNQEEKAEVETLKQKVKAKKINELRKQAQDDNPSMNGFEEDKVIKTPRVQKVKQEKKYYTAKDVEDAVLKGIDSYEKIRKERKVKKKAVKAEEEHKKKIFNTISKQTGEYDWSHCFN